MVQTPLEKIETLKHESFRGSTLYKQQAFVFCYVIFSAVALKVLARTDSCVINLLQATQRKGVAAGERKARKESRFV